MRFSAIFLFLMRASYIVMLSAIIFGIISSGFDLVIDESMVIIIGMVFFLGGTFMVAGQIYLDLKFDCANCGNKLPAKVGYSVRRRFWNLIVVVFKGRCPYCGAGIVK